MAQSQPTASDLESFARGFGIRIEASAKTAPATAEASSSAPPLAEGQAEMPPRKRRGRPPKTAPAIPAVGTGIDDSADQ